MVAFVSDHELPEATGEKNFDEPINKSYRMHMRPD